MTKRTISPDSNRAKAKARTRARVLTAAKELFTAAGYWGTNIRAIAAHAGMSTGAVFANFEDKDELFRSVLLEDLKELAEDVRRYWMPKDAESALSHLFQLVYLHYQDRLPFLRTKLMMECTTHAPIIAAFEQERQEFLDRIRLALLREEGKLRVSEYLVELTFAMHAHNLRELSAGRVTAEVLADKLKRQMKELLHPYWTKQADGFIAA